MGRTKELILRVQQGDKEAFEEYVKENEKLIYSIINRTLTAELLKKFEINEIFNIALFYLYKAMMRFDSSKGSSFSTFAFIHVGFGIVNDLKLRSRDSKQKLVTVPLEYSTKNVEEEESRNLLESRLFNSKNIDEYLLILELEDILKDLNYQDQLIFCLYFFEGLNQQEIGEIIGRNQIYVSRRIKKIKTYIKPYYI